MAVLMRRAWRLLGAACLGLVWMWVVAGGAAAATTDASPRMARGLIVKLKDQQAAQPSRTSLVRLQAAAVPTESWSSTRTHMATVARRAGVSYLVHRQTAFAAQLIHAGKTVPLAQAQAEAARLRADPDVEWVVVNEMLHPAGVVSQAFNDPAYAQQTWLQERESVQDGRQGVANIAAAWDSLLDWTQNQGKTLSPVVVAVLDNGILPAPDLAGRVLPGYDFVSEVEYSGDGDGQDNDPTDPGFSLSKVPASLRSGCSGPAIPWHGLRIAAMLGAQAGNALDGVGILAPVAGQVILPVRVGGMCGAAVSDIIEGMLWSAGISYQGSPARNPYPARVLNLSFGGDGSCADTGQHDAAWLYRDAINTLESKGVLVVASAGNGDAATFLGHAVPTRPASCPGVLAVTALNQRGYKARYANLVNSSQQSAVAVAGGDIDVVTDGSGRVTYPLTDDGIVSLTNTGDAFPSPDYVMQSAVGTSFSAPTAAGVAALMLAVDPSLTVAELRTALTTQVAPFPTVFSNALPVCQVGVNGQGNCICMSQTCGAGVLDAQRAVVWAMAHASANSGSAPNNATAASADSSCFVPDRLGGHSCASGNEGSGGGGSADEILLGLLAGGLALSLMRQRPARALAIKDGRR